jgi:hypothetical protein
MHDIKVNFIRSKELGNFLSVPKQRQVCVRTINYVGQKVFSAAKEKLKETFTLTIPKTQYKMRGVKANQSRLW